LLARNNFATPGVRTAMAAEENSDRLFIRRTLIVAAILSLFAFAWLLREVLLMVFGAVVVATLFRALAGVYQRGGVPERVSVGLAVLTVIAVIGGAGALFGAQLVSQAEDLSSAVPKAWSTVREQLERTGIPASVFQTGSEGVSGMAGNIAMSLGTGLADTLLILVGGIFLAASPKLYRVGAVKLVPEQRRGQVWEAFEASGRALQLWLKAQLLTMLLVGTVTGVGLWLIGVPSWFALALLAALLEFVPYVGPIAAAVPAILIAASVDPQTALLTIILYIVVQQLEGYVFSPLLQQWAVDLPGALLLFSLLACGTLFGAIGIIFAAPLTVVLYVLVKKLYVREALDTATPIPGEEDGEKERGSSTPLSSSS
jgi:predicted PurR-regulated permease PerM